MDNILFYLVRVADLSNKGNMLNEEITKSFHRKFLYVQNKWIIYTRVISVDDFFQNRYTEVFMSHMNLCSLEESKSHFINKSLYPLLRDITISSNFFLRKRIKMLHGRLYKLVDE